MQCYHCNKFGHFERECRLKNDNKGRSANYREEEASAEQMLFLSYGQVEKNLQETWLLDTGCSNHMTDKGEMLSSLDHSYKSSIRLGDNKSLTVAAKGVMEVATNEVKERVYDIYYTPNMKHNLLSVRQIIERNYKLVFDDGKCQL